MNKSSSNKKHNVLFLSYGEDLLQNKILQNQFIEFAKNFDGRKNHIHVYSVFPISRTRVKNNKKWNQDLYELKESLAKKEIRFTDTTLPALANWLYSTFWQFWFFHNIYHYVKLWLYFKNNNIQFVYCRGYHAGLAATFIKKWFCPRLKVQFDPRGLFIEEALYHKRFGRLSEKLWRRVEKFICETADLVTFVSEPFEQQLNENYKIKNSMVIYTHADIDKFLIQKTKSPPLKFCYLGQLDNSGWHLTKYLLQLFKAIHDIYDSELLIITQSDHSDILSQAKALGLEGSVKTVRASGSSQVAELLADCHFAIMSYKPCELYFEQIIAKTVVASKSGEYLAAGLPMICNQNLRGIADLIEHYDLGITYALGEEHKAAQSIEALMKNYGSMSERCREVAKNYFDIKKNVQFIQDEIDQLCAP